MRVFVTGATGFVGSAVTRELIESGHRVIGLARSAEAADRLEAAGAEAHRGTLEDLESLRAAATAADGVVHAGFTNISATTDFAAACRADRAAIEAIGESLAGSDRPFVVTSGTGLIAATKQNPATEDGAYDADSVAALRIPSEETALSFAGRGVRVSVLRLAPSVHSAADKAGFVPSLIGIARAAGVSAYPGEGTNSWATVHQLDAARLYRLALESAPAGSRLHGAGEQAVPLRRIAEAVGDLTGLPVVSVPAEKAAEHFGWITGFVTFEGSASSAATRRLLGWEPGNPGLVQDIEAGSYA